MRRDGFVTPQANRRVTHMQAAAEARTTPLTDELKGDVDTPNADLFVAVLAQIEREPQRWDQTWFASETDCGTAHCFAGWACILSGYNIVDDDYANYVARDGVEHHCPTLAETLLGIAPTWGADDESEHLFAGGHTLDDLYRISADILGLDETVLREKVAAVVADGAVQ